MNTEDHMDADANPRASHGFLLASLLAALALLACATAVPRANLRFDLSPGPAQY
jgi:hypothetical protein